MYGKNGKTGILLFLIITVIMAMAVILFNRSEYSRQKEEAVILQENTEDEVRHVLYIDSYYSDYEWSRKLTSAVLRVLNVKQTMSDLYVNEDKSLYVKIFRMDTKRNTSESFKKAAALEAVEIIEQWNPDVVIASDDNASEYLIAPYYKESEIPFVFCGLNWDASIYGFPTSNITGMVEVDLVEKLIKKLEEYSQGSRVGILYPDVSSSIKHMSYYHENLNLHFAREIPVQTFSQWKKNYIEVQNEVDILILLNYAGITDWDAEEAQRIVESQTRIPTGSVNEWMTPYSLITYAKSADEQGEWAALAALKILGGTKSGEIPVATNKKVVDVFLNHEIAEYLGVIFKEDILKLGRLYTAKGPYSYEEISKKDYSGITLDILTHDIPVMGEPTVLHARQFEELTGIKINIHHKPFGKLYQETVLGLKTNIYDIVFYGSLWIADMFEYLEPLPDKMLNSAQFTDILPHYRNIARWGDTAYQVSIDGDRHYLQYRSDLLGNPKYRKEFAESFGVELKPPETWNELNRIAEFFNGRELENGDIIYGISEITQKEDLLFSQFIKRAAPYARHPDIRDGFYFDLQTMKPLINTPGFVRALEDFVEAQNYYMPGGDNFTLSDVINTFGTGKTVFADNWDDSFIQAMEADSSITDNVGASLSPGSRNVWNRKTEEWDDFPEVNYAPYFAWGWTSGVSGSSRNKEAAFDFLGFFSNDENHFSDLQVGRFGVNPYRYSDINADFWSDSVGWNRSVAESYVNTLQDMAASKNRVMDLRIFRGRQYMDVLATGVFRALSGRDSPQSALDEVAARWDEITDTVGRDKQREAYSYIVEFENAEYSGGQD